ncbi:CD226 antigen isoform X1 [Tupaia chinensis]|uniref:CD226 antigen isoform X1 n=1 Tax=Tupaia chinensis TaxID=246437 RepID=UPI0003C8FA0D|nr:CD226 antigen isoform X1 [Tupaia chinensis]XP_027627132.1 CD226 antigen isoform X1 [Tupaia chinensis]
MDRLTFLLAILHVYKAICEEIFWDTTVKLAENMTLECVYPPGDTVTQMEWYKINGTDKDHIAIFSPSYGVIIRQPYDNRVCFLNSTMALNDMTLSFHNTSEADVGFYSCLLHTFPHGTWQKVIQVVQSDSFEIAVPSDSHIFSDAGENVTLSYELQMTWQAQQATWEKIQPHQIDLLAYCNLSQGRSYPSKYPRQILSSCTPEGRHSFIIIPQATASDSGLYRCSVKASTGENATFVMRLTVADGKTNNHYILFVATGTVLLLLVIVVIIITVISCNRRRKRQKIIRLKEFWDSKTKAGNNYRCPNSTNQPVDDAREDIYVNYPTFSRRPKTRT